MSVDPETKRALRALADAAFGGNMSALVTDLAEDARRRMAARAYAHRHGLGEPSKAEAETMEAEIRREVTAAKRRRRAAA